MIYTTTVDAIQWNETVKHPKIEFSYGRYWYKHSFQGYGTSGHYPMLAGDFIVDYIDGYTEVLTPELFHNRFTLKDKQV